MPIIEFHPEAVDDVEAAQEWYMERSFVAAHAFLAELSHAVTLVKESPDTWPKHIHSTRRYVFPTFPFSLVYRKHENVIQVVAVEAHKKKPGYWKGRGK